MILRPSENFDDRPQGRTVDMLVLHYTGMTSKQEALSRLCDPGAMVSAHYLIGEEGDIFQLVHEDRRAWHAGVASWRGHNDINARSIGVELVNPGHEFGYRDFPLKQIAVLIELCQDILSRHSIAARDVVGHADVAPTRKMDPGEKFPWRRLADNGVGLWPTEDYGPLTGDSPLTDQELTLLLNAYGYEVETSAQIVPTLIAFQRHFRPARVDGRADLDTVARLRQLILQTLEKR